jgi:ABC-type nitrate/sulfonate/bicarbonate transport system substrate-binding protein
MKTGGLAGVAVVAVLFASCGGGGEPNAVDTAPREEVTDPSAAEVERSRKLQDLELTLAGWEGPESAGILMADRRGYFADAGLSVGVLTPVSPVNSIKYVVQGLDDLGVAPEPQVVMAKSKGLPIVAVGSLIPRPTATMIWLRGSNVHRIRDLKGKTVAIPGLSFQKAFLESLLARAGLTVEDVKVKTVGYKLVPALVSGRADAIFGGSWNIEGLELKSRGLDPVAVPVEDLDLPTYEQLLVITRSDRAAKEQRMIRNFMLALRRGTIAAIEDPGATAAVIDTGDEADPEASRKDTEAEVSATLPLVSRSARMSHGRAARLVAWMHAEGLIQRKPPVSSLLTNRYLPKPERKR